MEDLTFVRTLLTRGYDAGELRRLLVERDLVRVRRGVYRAAGSRGPEDQHRLLIGSTMPFVNPDAVVSHGSAAVLHGLPVWTSALGHVHVTRNGQGGGRRRTNLRTHVAPLVEDEIVVLDDTAATSMARTVVDLSRTQPFEHGVAAADRALSLGLDPGALRIAAERARGWPGAPQARRVVEFADARSESPGESVSRVRLDEFGLPEPVPQFVVVDAVGRFVARSDFGWPELRTMGEFDGRTKYGRLLRAGDTPEQAVFREKLREDAVRDLDWQVVRWTTPDLQDFGPVAARLHRAFERGRR